jgi:hypothetical protein
MASPVMFPDRLRRLPRLLGATAIVLPALASWSAATRCEVSVQGTAQAVRVDAHQARLPEVLSALGTSLGVRHKSLIAVDEVIVGGSYSGTLEDVLRRLLKDLNYVITTQEDTVEIYIVGRPGEPPDPVMNKEPAPPVNANPAAQWRKSALQKP